MFANELNPYLKDGGTGLPPEEAGNAAKPAASAPCASQRKERGSRHARSNVLAVRYVSRCRH